MQSAPIAPSRSIVSEIARLIKPFVLSPCASAWVHLVERFMAAKEKIGEIEKLTADDDTDPKERMERIRELSGSLLKEW